MLSYPQPWQLFVIDTDASGDAIGGILHQLDEDFEKGEGSEDHFRFKESRLRPIAYESRRMSNTEQQYSAQEREMLVVDHCLRKFRGYVEGSPIVVRTDHESLKYFLTQKHLGRCLACFADNIAHFDVRIIYRPGCNQLAADALSRRPSNHQVLPVDKPGSLHAYPLDAQESLFDESGFQTLEDWCVCLVEDPASEPSICGFCTQNGALWQKISNGTGEIMVRIPTSLAEARALITTVHQQIGHLGPCTILDVLRTRVWMPSITALVEDIVRRCNACQFTCREAAKTGFETWP